MTQGMERVLITTATMTAIMMAGATPSIVAAQQRPVFSAAARLVPVSVTVRDSRGRPVTGLTREDFEVFSDDVRQPITDFRSEPSAITAALLVDKSGSMRVSSRATDATSAAHHLISWLSPTQDRIGTFAFDTRFSQTAAFEAVSPTSLSGLTMEPLYGATSLFDALAATSAALADEGSPRRAVVAITDGVDNASVLTAEEVSARAAAFDVPVYIVAISPVESETRLDELTAWTGGQFFVSTAPAQASQAAQTIVAELRQQYLLAFTPDPRPGWHRLTVRTTKSHKTVRARAGYITR
jgi:VWFA-related protein